ncbi:FecR family protein [Reichenbachiella faecimaris]|uniref:FecR family protein n=1 Tax=Reichenbachiella faecimaris TaxID=692418 RepID=A0A1W2G8F1_REIFA|nr:FecR domain-containing protein [Reichenbachiella faecimaris]SMD32959.1 FecR family protein [Reichenbachiella faecimaris]
MENNHTDKDAILAQWLNGDISADEAKKHLSNDEFLKYTQIVQEVDDWVPNQDTTIFDVQKVLSTKKEAKVITMSTWKYVSVAAAVLLMLFTGPLLYRSITTVSYKTAYGETRVIDLPDGTSTLYLSANSRVKWKKKDWKDGNRKLVLEGKAYLEVPQKGSFDVVTSEGTVSVLGTRFTVYQMEQALHAVCYEGRVRATATKGKSVELNKGEASLLLDGLWSAKQLFDIQYPEWIKDNIAFDNAPLKQVLNELESNFGIAVELGNVNLARRFTGSIPKSNLDQSLKIIFPALGISYRLEDNTLYLSE